MQTNTQRTEHIGGVTLVLGGSGKTGRRISERLMARGVATRIASRSTVPAFDWNDTSTWHAVLDGVGAVYISYAPDLVIPGATQTIQHLVTRTVEQGVERLVLLSGRGEEEAQACERIVQEATVDWTIVRASWFMQNFSEGEFLHMVHSGLITLPAALPIKVSGIALATLLREQANSAVTIVTMMGAAPRGLHFETEYSRHRSVAIRNAGFSLCGSWQLSGCLLWAVLSVDM